MISLDSLENMKIFAADSKQRDILLEDSTLIDGLVLLLSDNEYSVIKLTLEVSCQMTTLAFTLQTNFTGF